MVKKNCPSCAKKIERKFNFCPYCGVSFKAINERENYGFLGVDDEVLNYQPELKLPFGVGKIVDSLVRQLEKQMSNLDIEEGEEFPHGFKIKVSTGQPQVRQVVRAAPVKKIQSAQISDEEINRRMSLPREDAESKVRRLSDKIVYEIETPGVKNKHDISITELASGIEVRAYSSDKCYVKIIPLKVELIDYRLEKDRLFLELKG